MMKYCFRTLSSHPHGLTFRRPIFSLFPNRDIELLNVKCHEHEIFRAIKIKCRLCGISTIYDRHAEPVMILPHPTPVKAVGKVHTTAKWNPTKYTP